MQNFNYGSLFLANNVDIAWIVVAVVAVLAIVAAIVFWRLGAKAVTKRLEKEQGSIDAQRNRMLDDVREESKAIKKEAILEAKPNSVILIDEYAFCNCHGLVDVQMGNKITEMKQET